MFKIINVVTNYLLATNNKRINYYNTGSLKYVKKRIFGEVRFLKKKIFRKSTY